MYLKSAIVSGNDNSAQVSESQEKLSREYEEKMEAVLFRPA